jgi:3-oxoacyl-[acyl-carrier-protein] synthase III
VSFAAITGWGMAVPDRVVSNAELCSVIGVDEEWITRRTGILERRIAAPGETTATLATAAGLRALASAELRPAEIDLVVVATTTPDRMIPAVAPTVQAAIGAGSAGAFDVNAACAGFLTAATVCTSLIRTGVASRCLVIGAEVLSRFVGLEDDSTSILFGDGAGAVVLERSEEPAGLTTVHLGADGNDASLITVPAGGSLRPASRQTVQDREHFIRMNGREVFRAAIRTMVESSEQVMRSAGLGPEDVDLFICHQANWRIVAECADRLGIGPERVFSNVAHYANTSAASVPIALCEAAEAGRLAPGAKVLLTAVGAGLVWGAALVEWTAQSRRELEAEGDVVLAGRRSW